MLEIIGDFYAKTDHLGGIEITISLMISQTSSY